MLTLLPTLVLTANTSKSDSRGLRSSRSLPRTREGSPVRLFPRTARRRLAAATAVCCLALGALVVPLAMAEDGKDLKDRQKDAKQQVKHAQHDLDESSSRLRQDAAGRRPAGPRRRWSAPGPTCGSPTPSWRPRRSATTQMQQRLDAAEQRLATAQQELSDGQAALEAQRRVADRHDHRHLRAGRPAAAGLLRLLDAQTPADLTRQMEAQQRHRRPRGPGVRRPARRRGAAPGPRGPGRGRPRRRRGRARRPPPTTWSRCRACARTPATRARQGARAGRQPGQGPGRGPGRPASRPARPARGQEARAADPAADPRRRAARARGGYSGPTNGLLIRPVPGAVTSPFGYREHPIYHYWGLHDGTDFGVSCGEGMRAVAGGTVIAKYWSERLRQPALPLAGQHQRQERHRRLQPRHRLPRRRRRPGAAGRGRRVRRLDRLVDRLPPALHDPGQRHRRRPDEVALTLVASRLRRPERMVGWPRRPGAS